MKLIYKIWRPFAIWFSNFHWNYALKTCSLNGTDYMKVGESRTKYIKRIAENIMNAFRYKHDGFDELGDTIPPPAEAYFLYTQHELKDDCDGFHAALYHAAELNNIECKLLEVFSTRNFFGHCVLLFNDNGWKICDYTNVMDLNEAYDYYLDKTKGKFVTYEVVWNGEKYRTKEVKDAFNRRKNCDTGNK